MIAKMKREIRELKEEVRRLKPNQSAGLLTSQTTKGVNREVNGAAARLSRANRGSNVARWA